MNASARSFVGDKSRLADEECARYAGTRGIVFDGKISVCVLVVRAQSGQGCHNHSVLDGDGADLDGLKKLGSGHCKVSVGSGGSGGLLRAVTSTCIGTSFIRQFVEGR